MSALPRFELDGRPLVRAGFATIGLAAVIAAGSRGGRWIDPALLGYLIACLFAFFGVAYRYFAWLERPATAMFWRWTLKGLTTPKRWLRIPRMAAALADQMVLQRFIDFRAHRRWAAHALIAWGCMLAFAVTFPLVFGWVRFTSEGLNPDRYQAWFFGFPAGAFALGTPVALLAFHILDVAAVMVIAGCLLAFMRRLKDEGEQSTQRFGLDLMPLLLLVAVSLTGLLLTASVRFLDGRNYGTLAFLHEMTVILLLLSLPFGKLFHIVQRPAQAGATLYREEGETEGLRPCATCGRDHIRPNQRKDLERLWNELDLKGAVHSNGVHHLDLCPSCRRRTLMKAHSQRLHGAFDPFAEIPLPTEPIDDAVSLRS
ncbi:MAG: MFS transporter [Holophaga sp.]|nr:MFS transporter [Holophaga sp.]